jgi:type IX secretion system PorP/SprF family membrane protein
MRALKPKRDMLPLSGDFMKKVLSTIILMLSFVSVIAQSNIRLNTYWDNTYFINPAYINEKNLAEFKMATRKQWVNFPGSPITLFASGSTYIENIHAQFGMKILQDQIGYTSTSDIQLTYGYSSLLNNSWKIHLGVEACFQMVGYDKSKMKFEGIDDPNISDKLLSENNFNAGVGVELSHQFWRFGASSQNIVSLFYPINKQFTNVNYVYAMCHEFSHDYMNIGYGAAFINNASIYQMEFNMTGYFKVTPEADAFQVGLFYRTWSEIGFLLGVDISSNLKLTYSYDYNVSGISQSSYGSHEIMVSYRLDRVWHCHNCWY